MPTPTTKYRTFDGQEFANEKEAADYEALVRKRGIEVREAFISHFKEDSEIDSKLLDFIKSYSNDDAWKIMRSLVVPFNWFKEYGLEQDEWLWRDVDFYF